MTKEKVTRRAMKEQGKDEKKIQRKGKLKKRSVSQGKRENVIERKGIKQGIKEQCKTS